jgi:hypothetical protein
MTFFNPYLALEKIEEQGPTPASSASFASKPPKSTQKEAIEAKEAAPSAQIPNFAPDQETAPTTPSPDDCRHGHTVDGTPKTWTGKVVSLDAWRQLSEWEKHGPDGRQWNGKTQSWEIAE